MSSARPVSLLKIKKRSAPLNFQTRKDRQESFGIQHVGRSKSYLDEQVQIYCKELVEE
jgi:hypothetical protein